MVSRPEPRLVGPQTPPPIGECVPTEKDKSSLPPYTVEPPDILFIEAMRVVPKPPYHIQASDVLQIIAEPPEAGLTARRLLRRSAPATSTWGHATARSRSAA